MKTPTSWRYPKGTQLVADAGDGYKNIYENATAVSDDYARSPRDTPRPPGAGRRLPALARINALVQYNARNSTAVKLVTKASQWRKIVKRDRRRKGQGALNLRIASFLSNQSGRVSCIVLYVLNSILRQVEYHGVLPRVHPLLRHPMNHLQDADANVFFWFTFT
ncbi:hypothetical protein EVAR_38738_1 [Eumeta japonica]|uniref:Uncharacterized protein n=1 Tax=Eumeta variegata TaxID=151549 RepID=A0A4C1YRA2_EUMVA|nr:hypothetical protein EVAR_38738_1 [Eumeta japonica]